MVFGAEAMLPSEIALQSPRVTSYLDNDLVARWEDDINQIEEFHDRALIQATRYQHSLWRYHNRKVQERTLVVGDLILRHIQNKAGRNNLSPKWERPYKVVDVT